MHLHEFNMDIYMLKSEKTYKKIKSIKQFLSFGCGYKY